MSEESNANESIKELRKLLKEHSSTSQFDFQDAFLLKFLRSQNFSVVSAKRLIQNYVELFVKYPQYFDTVESLKKAFEIDFFSMDSANRCKNGELLCIMKPGNWEPDIIDFFRTVAVTVYTYELAELDENVQKNGAIEIVDMKGLGWKHYTHVGLSELRFIVDMTENSLPIKWKKIFVVNQNMVTTILYNMAKPFMSKELKERVEFIGNKFERLQELIPPEMLPTEYGGLAENLHGMDCFEYIKKNEGQLLNLWKQFKVDRMRSNSSEK